MPNDMGIYVANGNPEDATFIEEHFVEGTKWEIYEYGEFKGVFTVGTRFERSFEGRNFIINHVTRDRDGWEGQVFLYRLEAKPHNRRIKKSLSINCPPTDINIKPVVS